MADTRSQKQLLLFREVLPMLTILADTFQKNPKVTGDFFVRLYSIADAIKPGYSDFGYNEWNKIVGSADSAWNSKSASSQYDVDAKVKNYSAYLLAYVKAIVDTDEQQRKGAALDQLSKDFAMLRKQLDEVLQKLAINLSSSSQFQVVESKVNQLQTKLGELDMTVTVISMEKSFADRSLEQSSEALDDVRSQIESLRQQHTSLLALLVQSSDTKAYHATSIQNQGK